MPTLGVVHGFAPNLLRCVHPDPPAELTVSEYWAFYPGVRAALLDSTGAWVSDHPTTAGVSVGASDSRGALDRDESGDPALVFARIASGTVGSISIGDLNSGAVATRFGTTGDNGVHVLRGSLLFAAGYGYWLEVQRDSSMTSRLIARSYRLPASNWALAAIELISTVNLDHAGTVTNGLFNALSAGILGGDLYFLYQTQSPDSTVWLINATAGSAASGVVDVSGSDYIAGPVMPASDGAGYGLYSLTGFLGKTSDVDTFDGQAHWPTTFGDAGVVASQTPDLSELGNFRLTTVRLMHDFAEGTWGTDPRRDFTLAAHPVHATLPIAAILRDPAQG